MQRKAVVCRFCGRENEHLAGRMPCEELTGWTMVSIWKGKESVDHHCFCSIGCLRDWLDEQSPKIPGAFLNAFKEEEEQK